MKKNYYCFVLYGVSLSLKYWLEKTILLFSENKFPLKSVSYDKDRKKLGRKSIKSFLKEFENTYESYFITLFTGSNQKHPSTWSYGVSYDTLSEEMVFFFEDNIQYQEICKFLDKYLSKILKNVIAHSGYSYNQIGRYDYSSGGSQDMNLYKEDSLYFWKILKPENLNLFLDNKMILRHIYKENILNEAHLNIEIDDIKLCEWIKKNDLGNLKAIGKGNYFWVIPDEKIDFVTKKFFENRILVGVSENRAIEIG